MLNMQPPSEPADLNSAIKIVNDSAANISANLTNLSLHCIFQFTDCLGTVFVHSCF